MTDTQTFEPEGRAIPYVVEGEGPVPLVLIAEPGQDALGVVGHYLAEEAGFHIIRIGYGPGERSLDDRASDVMAVIDHLELDHTWIGGHGFGGTVARTTVAAHPERANGLLLLGVEDVDIPLPPVIPVLIVQATDDAVTPVANAERLQATAPERATIRTVEGAGHLFPLTHIMDTAVFIEEYLDWD
ncbi:alpha/beta fold hydrolase [Microbacterium sp.]|uniref:alpha/beta fold hydrolase n=1 Tax=Microbacterium sp. TaxID=51671 RepID=UPI003F6FB987